MICETLVGNRIHVPHRLLVTAKRAPRTDSLHQVGDDIWTTYAPIKAHCDGTAPSLVTYGFIIVNDAKLTLFHGSNNYAIPPGTLYRMDSRIIHAAMGDHGLLFAALIWDMPPAWDLAAFAKELAADPRFR